MSDNNITITTRFNDDVIQQSEKWPGDDIGREIRMRVINLRDQGIRDALVKMGWTPPGSDDLAIVNRKALFDCMMLLDPEPIEVDGKTMVFVNPMAAEILQHLSKAVRRLRDDLHG